MKKARLLVLAASHTIAVAVGFGAGVYTLPLLIAPPAPSEAEVRSASEGAQYSGTFRRDLRGSDFLHWGEGVVSVGPQTVSLKGRLAPGPDYKLYLSPKFVDTKEAFLQIKPQALRIGDVKTFENFIVPLPASAELSRYDTVVVWCETFSMFITAAKYR